MEQHQLCRRPRENRKDNERRKCDDCLGEIGAARVDRIGHVVFRKKHTDDKTASQKDHHPKWQRNAKICPRLTYSGWSFLRVNCHWGLSSSSSTVARSSEPAFFGTEIVTQEGLDGHVPASCSLFPLSAIFHSCPPLQN